jgi:hypothetical protein
MTVLGEISMPLDTLTTTEIPLSAKYQRNRAL